MKEVKEVGVLEVFGALLNIASLFAWAYIIAHFLNKYW